MESSIKFNEQDIIDVLKTVYDPEISVNIFELGLIYDIQIKNDGLVLIKMTLTSPNCPAAEMIPGEVKEKIKSISGVKSAEVEIVWEPPWNPNMMSEAAKLELGFL